MEDEILTRASCRLHFLLFNVGKMLPTITDTTRTVDEKKDIKPTILKIYCGILKGNLSFFLNCGNFLIIFFIAE